MFVFLARVTKVERAYEKGAHISTHICTMYRVCKSKASQGPISIRPPMLVAAQRL